MTAAPPPPWGSLAAALLLVLAEEAAATAGSPRPVSLPRLVKRLDQGGSVLLRELALMGAQRIGAYVGPGWVEVGQDGERWLVRLTDAGSAAAALIEIPPDPDE